MSLDVEDTRRQRDRRTVRNLRYFVLFWLLLAGILNYMDRASVSIAAPHMIEELGLTQTDIGLMGSVFSWTYAICQLPVGYLIDKVGPRRMYFLAVGVWSIASALMALGHTLGHFLLFRVLLGIGESPNSPNSSKITTHWFPRSERGQAAGIWDSGSKWGSAIAPPILTVLMLAFGWRAMFLVLGVAGIVLAVAFWAFYRSPEHAKHLSDEEYRHILAGRDDIEDADAPRIPWLKLFTFRQTWGMMLGFFTSIWIWNIFITFLPLYLQNSLGVSIGQTGVVASVPYVVAALGAIFGGRITLVLARRGRSPLASKRIALIIASLGAGALLCLVPLVSTFALALVVLSLALGLIAVVQSQAWAATSDIVPDAYAARFGGIMNFGGYFGGALAPVVTGMVFDATGSYSPSFILAGLIAALGAVFFGLLIRRPIPQREAAERAAA
ncbi:MFS transporter [Brachybacterium endophyticum]|uniref:MFS transporter n=1 Tax=Brachybacterium endophyticum TaxID=2182385 RepID=A0A2U2RMT6_9MICO|nr:MFS transporter [Brachybacterium endophyticum]PWH07190.1 MFS transporter [Brachybacterium endophyticum]